jgi:hypothetical protein
MKDTKPFNLLCCVVNAEWVCLDCKALECNACMRLKGSKHLELLGCHGHLDSCTEKQDFHLLESKGIRERLAELNNA